MQKLHYLLWHLCSSSPFSLVYDEWFILKLGLMIPSLKREIQPCRTERKKIKFLFFFWNFLRFKFFFIEWLLSLRDSWLIISIDFFFVFTFLFFSVNMSRFYCYTRKKRAPLEILRVEQKPLNQQVSLHHGSAPRRSEDWNRFTTAKWAASLALKGAIGEEGFRTAGMCFGWG